MSSQCHRQRIEGSRVLCRKSAVQNLLYRSGSARRQIGNLPHTMHLEDYGGMGECGPRSQRQARRGFLARSLQISCTFLADLLHVPCGSLARSLRISCTFLAGLLHCVPPCPSNARNESCRPRKPLTSFAPTLTCKNCRNGRILRVRARFSLAHRAWVLGKGPDHVRATASAPQA
jgi:hypothetical protein